MGLKFLSDEDPLEAIKKAILQHEDTFRHQVHELHRLYWTQKNLMGGSFSGKDFGDQCDPSMWRFMPVPERGSMWSRSLIPPEHSAGFFENVYHCGQGGLNSLLPPGSYGCHQVDGYSQKNELVYNGTGADPTLELSLGGSNRGKRNVSSAFYGEDCSKRPEVIDLDDSVETVVNEGGMNVTSFGPKTPTIVSEARREHKQANEKARKFLDCAMSADPIGQNAINSINSNGHFSARLNGSTRKATLFDLNTSLPIELDDNTINELDDVSSTAIDLAYVHKPSNEFHAYLSNAQSESNCQPPGKTSVGTAADTLHSSSRNTLTTSDSKVLEGFVNMPENLVAGSQQSSNGSSPFSSFHPDSPKNKTGVSSLECQLASDNGMTCSAVCSQGADTLPSQCLESDVACEERGQTTVVCSIDINQELDCNMVVTEEGPLDMLWSTPAENLAKTTINSCATACGIASEHPVAENDVNCDALAINSQTASISDSEKQILRGCSSKSIRIESCKGSSTCNVDEFTVRWPEEVDPMVLMASTSLVHFSLVNSLGSGYAMVGEEAGNGKISDQQQCSIDSLEQIILTLPENQEVECSSPFKPVDELVLGSRSRYSSRSGRKLRDFQKDVLPGIVALSRHEICEDMHAFTEIVRSGEVSRKGMTVTFRKNRYTVGRGRRSRRR